MTNKFFVIGKGTAHSPSKLKAHYGDSLQVIGDGKSAVDIAEIATHESGDRFILNPHGCPDGVSFDQANIIHPSALLEQIKEQVDIEIISCFSGVAHNYLGSLKEGSTLITFANKPMLVVESTKIIEKSTSFAMQNNVFARFAHYIFTQTNDLTFSLKVNSNAYTFSTNIDEILTYEIEEIITWQASNMKRFVDFVERLPRTAHNQDSIESFLVNLATISCYDIQEYQELLKLNSMFNNIYDQNFERVKYIIDNGFDVNKKYEQIDSLVLAVQYQSLKAVEIIAPLSSSINELISGVTLLADALQRGQLEIAEVLLQHGANVNQEFSEGNTLLMRKACEGNEEAVKLLIKYNADVNMVNIMQYAAISFAVNGKNVNIVKMLINNGADINIQDIHKQTALCHAVCKKHLAIVKILLKYAADTNHELILRASTTQDIKQELALFNANKLEYVLRNNQANLAELFIAISNLLKKDNSQKVQDMHMLKMQTEIEYLKAAFKAGYAIDTEYTGGKTLLHLSADKNNVEVVRFLLENGANPNKATTEKANVPLHLAANKGFVEIVDLLLSHGADASLATLSGNTALQIAERKGYEAIVERLYNLERTQNPEALPINGYDVIPSDSGNIVVEAVEYPSYNFQQNIYQVGTSIQQGIISYNSVKILAEDLTGITLPNISNDWLSAAYAMVAVIKANYHPELSFYEAQDSTIFYSRLKVQDMNALERMQKIEAGNLNFIEICGKEIAIQSALGFSQSFAYHGNVPVGTIMGFISGVSTAVSCFESFNEVESSTDKLAVVNAASAAAGIAIYSYSSDWALTVNGMATANMLAKAVYDYCFMGEI